MKQNPSAAGLPFIAIGIAFIAIGISSNQVFLFIGIAFIVIGIGIAVRNDRRPPTV